MVSDAEQGPTSRRPVPYWAMSVKGRMRDQSRSPAAEILILRR